MITDATPRIVRVNAAFEQMTGYTEAEVRGRKPSVLRADVRPRGFYADMWRRLELSGRWDGELWNRRKDGSPYPELLSIGVVRDREGKVTHYVGQFADITERKDPGAHRYRASRRDRTAEPCAARRPRAGAVRAGRARNVRAGVLFSIDRFRTSTTAQARHGDDCCAAGPPVRRGARDGEPHRRRRVRRPAELQHPADARRIARNRTVS
jgi:PAS domain S-box-containing protein